MGARQTPYDNWVCTSIIKPIHSLTIFHVTYLPSSFLLRHEIAGTAVRVGSEVKGIKVGDRVGAGAMIGSCYSCKACTSGNENYCRKSIFTYVRAHLTEPTLPFNCCIPILMPALSDLHRTWPTPMVSERRVGTPPGSSLMSSLYSRFLTVSLRRMRLL